LRLVGNEGERVLFPFFRDSWRDVRSVFQLGSWDSALPRRHILLLSFSHLPFLPQTLMTHEFKTSPGKKNSQFLIPPESGHSITCRRVLIDLDVPRNAASFHTALPLELLSPCRSGKVQRYLLSRLSYPNFYRSGSPPSKSPSGRRLRGPPTMSVRVVRVQRTCG
jgi:hypothetical protein